MVRVGELGSFQEAKLSVGCLICVMQHMNGMTCLFCRIGPMEF
jgi:hypothetical protein